MWQFNVMVMSLWKSQLACIYYTVVINCCSSCDVLRCSLNVNVLRRLFSLADSDGCTGRNQTFSNNRLTLLSLRTYLALAWIEAFAEERVKCLSRLAQHSLLAGCAEANGWAWRWIADRIFHFAHLIISAFHSRARVCTLARHRVPNIAHNTHARLNTRLGKTENTGKRHQKEIWRHCSVIRQIT
jgi:hypothetical protein